MFRQLREEAETTLSVAPSSLDLSTDDLGVEEPSEGVPAAFASSVAFRLTGVVGAPPPKVAADIAEELSVEGYDYLAAVDTQGPYVNFHVSDVYYDGIPDAVASDETYGRLPMIGNSAVVEHTSANLTGPVHVSRTHNSVIGDVVANLSDSAGNNANRHCYVNDTGRQMVIFTWVYETFDEDDLESEPAHERVEYDLIRYYYKGNAFLEGTNPEKVEWVRTEITETLQGIKEGDEETYVRVETVVDRVLGGIREYLGRFSVEFDEFIKETRFMFDGSTRDLVERLKETGHAIYEEDAWQLGLNDYNFRKNLVFLQLDDASLHTTHDLTHHEQKLDNRNRAMTALDEDHKLQSGQPRVASNILGNDVDKLENVTYLWVSLPGSETMSVRKGADAMLDDLLDKAINHARDEVETHLGGRIRDNDLDETDIDRITRQVGIGTIRYDIVSKQPTKTITFEWGQALNFEAQPAPYIQYVHAHCRSITGETTIASLDVSEADPTVLTTDAERDLLATITRFPAVVETAADDLGPHTVVTFAHELTEVFNIFYHECSALDADGGVGTARLVFVEVSRNMVANALIIVGVEAPEST